jgi:hypothetical protein
MMALTVGRPTPGKKCAETMKLLPIGSGVLGAALASSRLSAAAGWPERYREASIVYRGLFSTPIDHLTGDLLVVQKINVLPTLDRAVVQLGPKRTRRDLIAVGRLGEMEGAASCQGNYSQPGTSLFRERLRRFQLLRAALQSCWRRRWLNRQDRSVMTMDALGANASPSHDRHPSQGDPTAVDRYFAEFIIHTS